MTRSRPSSDRKAATATVGRYAVGGFTLVEMMVAVALLLVVMSGVSGLYLAHRNARVAEDLSQTVQAQLRLGMGKMLFRLRNAGYGVPWGGDLTLWVTWVGGFNENPKITAGAGASDPDTVSTAGCTSKPVAWLASDAAKDATSLALDSAAAVDAASRSVIMINDSESLKILSTSGNTIGIDGDPAVLGAQGISKNYRAGTPVCRVDVITYSVDVAAATLREDLNQGAGPQVLVDGITNLKIAKDTSGVKHRFQVTLTARAADSDPLTTTVAQRSLTSIATSRN